MEVFPGAYIAKAAIKAASALGAAIITIVSFRANSALRHDEHYYTSILPLTIWLAFFTFWAEGLLLAEAVLGEDEGNDNQKPITYEKLDRIWCAAIWVIWLIDAVFVTRVPSVASWSSVTSSRMGATCALVWIQWLLLTARLLVMGAETARIHLSHMLDALRGKLAPWWKMAKQPLVQIAASVGILLGGVAGSVGMLVTGVFGLLDDGLGLIGLRGMRKKIFNNLGLYKISSSVDRMLDPVGLGGIIGGGEAQDKKPKDLSAVSKNLGIDGTASKAGGKLKEGVSTVTKPLGVGSSDEGESSTAASGVTGALGLGGGGTAANSTRKRGGDKKKS